MVASGKIVAALAIASTLTCKAAVRPPLVTVEYVDLERFMGDWYVIANIPTWIERRAHNAVESYRLDSGGAIATTFTFRDGGFDGAERRYSPKAFVRDDRSNARWGMQFVWPVEADYRIIYLNEDYTQTVIGRHKRDYVWVMARTPEIPDEDYLHLVRVISEAGYDVTRLAPVPQRWHDVSSAEAESRTTTARPREPHRDDNHLR